MSVRRTVAGLVMMSVLFGIHAYGADAAGRSLADTAQGWPSSEQWLRLLTLQDYNTRVVLLGALFLGIGSGVVGTFMLLRKRALMGDAVSHATLPGIGIAFLVMVHFGGTGKFLPGLLLGGLLSGLLGMGTVLWIRSQTRLKEDAALGIALSVFFGIGVSILVTVQKGNLGHAAGLESFIYGKTASMVASDARLIGVTAFVITALCVLLYKEFCLLCFDQGFASTQGWPTVGLDIVMMGLVVAITVIGLQAVGLILMIALLITPPAAARFWTHQLKQTVWLAGTIGGVSCLVGAGLSALLPRMPAGAVIVLVGSSFFLVSMLLGKERGLLVRWTQHRHLSSRIRMQHLLRAVYEWQEEFRPASLRKQGAGQGGMPWDGLLQERAWTSRGLRQVIRKAMHEGWIEGGPGPVYALTDEGHMEASRMVRNHRLWELYLITHADIAPSHVDRDADMVEHVLGRELVAELEEAMHQYYPKTMVPPSPHRIGWQEPGGDS